MSTPSMTDRIQSTDVPTLVRNLRICNIIIGILVVASGVSAFFGGSVTLNFAQVIGAVYVIMFGLLFMCFESGIDSVMKLVYENAGFMFKWQGRLLYFTFMGTICLILGNTFGYIVAGLVFCAVFINIWIMNKNPAFFNATIAEGISRQQSAQTTTNTVGGDAARAMEMGKIAVVVAQNPAAQKAVSAAVSANTSSNPLDNNPDWEKNLDEHSGTYYYFNRITNETRWQE